MPLKQRITRDILKDKIGEYNIFAYYFGSEFKLKKAYNSALREDDHKSTAFFLTEHESILYNDFALSKKYDFVQFVMEKYGIKYYAAIEQIAADFGLIAGKLTGSKVAKIKPHKPIEKPIKRQITINTQTFKKQHIDYWAGYCITLQELKDNYVHAISSFSTEDFIIAKSNELRFAFLIKDIDEEGDVVFHPKFYTPFSDKFKWVSYCPLNVMFGYLDLTFESDTLFICKSQKERLIIKKLFKDVVSLQSENKGSIDPNKMLYLKSKFKRIIYFGDNDEAGLRFCEYIKKEYDYIETYTYPPDFFKKFKIKDIGDFVKTWGVESLELYFKRLKLL